MRVFPKYDKPELDYTEIEYPRDKRDEVIACWPERSLTVHTNAEAEFEYLGENDCAIVAKNPHGGHDITFDLVGEFILFFAGWHAHYFPYEYDFQQMLQDADDIMNNRKCVIIIEEGERWRIMSLFNAQAELSAESIVAHFREPVGPAGNPGMEKDYRGCVALIRYWDGSMNREIPL